MSPAPSRSLILASLALSAAGHVIHNLAEFPVAILWSWETLVPLAVTAVLGGALLRRPGTASYAGAAGWALVVLVVGGGSVLPVGALPFVPEQSLSHYLAHLAYAVTQLPLVWVGYRGLTASIGAGAGTVAG
jgi:hypothetical protein